MGKHGASGLISHLDFARSCSTLSALMRKELLVAGRLITILTFFASVTRANEWPQFRGPNRDGVSQETGLLKDWPAGGLPLALKATGLGKGYSTLSIADGKVFTIGDRSDAGFVMVVKEEDGKPAWSAKLGQAGAPGFPSFEGPRAAPTVDGKLVVALGQWGELVCFDSSTGAEKWRKDYKKDSGGTRPEWGFAEGPLIDGDKVVITPGGRDGAIVALSKDSGAIVWRSKDFTDLAHYS